MSSLGNFLFNVMILVVMAVVLNMTMLALVIA